MWDLLINLLETPANWVKSLRRMLKRRRLPKHVFVEVGDRSASEAIEQAIPPVVYQTVKTKLIDDEHHAGMERFRDMNPELSFVVLDEEQTNTYMQDSWGTHPIFDVYQRALYGQIKADIFRLCIVNEKGGYYLDINKAAYINWPSLHKRDDHAFLTFDSIDCLSFPEAALAAQLEYPHRFFAQWAFGFTRGHAITTNAINRIVERAPFFAGKSFRDVRNAIFATSGPAMLTDVIRDYLRTEGFEGVAMAGEFFNGTGVSRIAGAHRTPEKTTHYTQARRTQVLAE